jgi:HEAT repeat protein
MTGAEVLGPAVASVTALGLTGFGVVTGRRARRSRSSRAQDAVRPVLFGTIDSGVIDVAALHQLRRTERRALAEQARSLLPQLRGEDHDHLVRLLEHLGAMRTARRQLHSRRSATRARAGRFLGEAGRPAAVDDLLRLLHDPVPSVRWSAARSLGRLGHPSAVSPLLGALEGERSIPADVVVQAVAQIRDCPVAVLRQGLSSRSVPVRAVTVELLGRFQALAATPDLIGRLRDDSSIEVRTRAAQALGRLGSPRAVDALLACLAEGPPAMHPQVVWALGEIGAPQAVPALRAALTGASAQLRGAAAHALEAVRAPDHASAARRS